VPPLQLRLAARSLVSLEATMPGAFHAVDSVPMQAAYLAIEAYYLCMHCNVLSCNTTTA
jgi:hypothetical protein